MGTPGKKLRSSFTRSRRSLPSPSPPRERNSSTFSVARKCATSATPGREEEEKLEELIPPPVSAPAASLLPLDLLEIRIKELERMVEIGKKKEHMWGKAYKLKLEEVEQSRRVGKEQRNVLRCLEEEVEKLEKEHTRVEEKLCKATTAMEVMRAAALQSGI